MLSKGALSNLIPFIIRLALAFIFLNLILATSTWNNNNVSTTTVSFYSIMSNTISNNTQTIIKFIQLHPIQDVLFLFLIGFGLVVYRLFQRCYLWSTYEYKEAPNVKDASTYKNVQLLNKAWNQAANVGWVIPKETTTEQEIEALHTFRSKHGKIDTTNGSSVVFQPRSGWCGLASLTSTLRSFASTTPTAMPWLKMHQEGRYLELLQAKEILEKICFKNKSADQKESIWEKNGGGKIASMEIIGGGNDGIPSYESFLHALKQINHPTQPARILAIYGRSPMFFCHDGKLSTKIKTFMMGHWSPLPAYLEDENLVLVMDVNRDYGSRGYLVPPKRLYEAVNTKCCMNGQYRGLILLRPPPNNSKTSKILTNPIDLSVTFGNIKKEYYQHIANAGTNQYVKWTQNNDKNNEKNDDLGPLSNIISTHPVSFTNATFINSNDLSTLKLHHIINTRKLFINATSPMRMTIRGCTSKYEFQKIRTLCEAAGLVLFMEKTTIWTLSLLPIDVKQDRLIPPTGFTLEEIETGDTPTILQWGKVVAKSYGMPNVKRNDLLPGDHQGQSYINVKHGNRLRQFVLRDGSKQRNENVIATCTLYVNETKTIGCMFNVCCLSEYRQKGIGKFMSCVIIHKASEMGCIQLLLEASPKGQRVYKKLGFIQRTEEHGGSFISLSIATTSCRWVCLFWIVEKILSYKKTLIRLMYVLVVVVLGLILSK